MNHTLVRQYELRFSIFSFFISSGTHNTHILRCIIKNVHIYYNMSMRRIPTTNSISRKNIIKKKHSNRKTRSKQNGGSRSPRITDYSNQDLTNKDFSGANLAGADFSGAKLSGSDFTGANLTGANLKFVLMFRSLLKGANLKGANLSRSDLAGTNLADANLTGANLKGARLDGINFVGATLTGVDLEGANLEGSNFEGVDLSDLDLESLNIQRANFKDAELNKVNLTNANLTGAYLNGANLKGANLSGAILIGTDLEGANLTNADLEGANLTGARLQGAILTGANLEDDSVLRTMLDSPTSTSIYHDSMFHSTSTLRELLKRKSVKLTKYPDNPFKNGILSSYNVILLEDVNYCEYIKNKNNLLIFFGKQVAIIDRETLKQFIDTTTVNPDNIVYRCKDVDGAFMPRNSNIISGPTLNMTAIGLNGPIVPLEYLDQVVKGVHQIFMIEPTDNVKKMPIASLGTRLGGSVVSANHCQANVNKQMCTISYIENNTLLEACKPTEPKTGGKNTRKKTIRKRHTQKRKITTKQR